MTDPSPPAQRPERPPADIPADSHCGPPPHPVRQPPRAIRPWVLLTAIALLLAGLLAGVLAADRLLGLTRSQIQTTTAVLKRLARQTDIDSRSLDPILKALEQLEKQKTPPAGFYTCGMHPWVILPQPGDCPICHMTLTPLDPQKFTGEVTINPIVLQNIGVRIAPVQTGPLVRTIRTVGTVDYDETRLRDINIKVSGWIEKLHVNYLGSPVQVDQALFDIYSPQLYAAQEEYLLALKNRLPADTDASRQLLLSSRTRLQYFDITDQQIRELEKHGRPFKTLTIRSPYPGVVIEKHANEGMKVDPGMRVFRIADLSKVWVMVTLYEYQLPFVQVGQDAEMTLPYIPGQTFHGKVIYLYPYLDKKTRQIQVRLEFDNPDGLLKPGMYANVQLRSRLARDRILAPRSAVIDTGDRRIAFVSRGGGRFEPRQVWTGIETDAGKIEILKGLKPGEMVVTSGQFLIDSEARIREALAKMVRGQQAAEQQAVAPTASTSMLTTLPDALADLLGQAIRQYLAIGDRLAIDRTDGIDQSAGQLSEHLAALMKTHVPGRPHFWHQHEELATARSKALELVGANTLEQARLLYGDLSVALAGLLKATGIPPNYGRSVIQMHCPMYRKDQGGVIWLQHAGPARNPYMGTDMPGCFDSQLALPVTGQPGPPPAPPQPDPGESPSHQRGQPGAGRPEPPVRFDASERQLFDQALASYLALHRLLAADKETSAAGPLLARLHQTAATLAERAHPPLAPAARSLAEAANFQLTDKASLRQGLAGLSQAMLALVRLAHRAGALTRPIHLAYCPMVKQSWLQDSTEIHNPYDPAMPSCGMIRQTFGARPDSTE